MPLKYRCEHCKGEFDSTDEADSRAHAEAKRLWGKDGHAPGMAIICDDCFKQMRDAGFVPVSKN